MLILPDDVREWIERLLLPSQRAQMASLPGTFEEKLAVLGLDKTEWYRTVIGMAGLIPVSRGKKYRSIDDPGEYGDGGQT